MLKKAFLEHNLPLRSVINSAYRMKESEILQELIHYAQLERWQIEDIRQVASDLVKKVRQARRKTLGMDTFLQEYALSSEEGVALLCLAEALLRVPDKDTVDQLIKDKLTKMDWSSHIGQSDSFFINAATWGLMLTGKILNPEQAESRLSKAILTFVNRSSESVVRKVMEKAMRIIGQQFVMGQSIQEALKRAKKNEAQGYRYSYDMLGEAAITAEDANRYFEAYLYAIETIGAQQDQATNIYQRPGISIKLSALHPRYQETQRDRIQNELPPKLLKLAQAAKQYGITMTIDAEESERLELSLDVIEAVFNDDSLDGWHGFGLAVQSYQKRAFFVLDWVYELALKKKRRIMVRLIKGAYWDSEIKRTQVLGLRDYPVFTRKVNTDVSFQACAKKLLTMTQHIYPQFATHNAYSVAAILTMAGSYRDFEFQCLHGMGKELYGYVVSEQGFHMPCRIYAPVGTHKDLLPYLVRRLLENGANTSFVNRIVDEKAPIESLIEDPIAKASDYLDKPNPNIPLPADIFMPARKNSQGVDFSDRSVISAWQTHNANLDAYHWDAKPIIFNTQAGDLERSVCSPQWPAHVIGGVSDTHLDEVEQALNYAEKAQFDWATYPVEKRAVCLENYALLLEKNQTELLDLLCLEAGKTWQDSVGEVREAIDFCRYYAKMARKLLTEPTILKGYTGEYNALSLHPRGIALCISPWNFPLAIFTGQIVAALVVGNCVIAKPAEQTPLIAAFAVRLMHEAGIPHPVIQLLPGPGETVGARLVADTRIKAILFTGSTATAQLIQKSLAERGGEMIPFIAETGGLNAMIVDSSALLEQVVMDVLVSAFGSAGQRCSALRVLYLQEDVYDKTIQLLKGAMAELKIGHPDDLSTDIGPVIDASSLKQLQDYVAQMRQTYEILYECSLPNASRVLKNGYFMPPIAFAVDSIKALPGEVFGPILHVISYQRKHLDNIIHDLNSTGYGLTLGIQSRVTQIAEYIRDRVHAGNCYVNRNMIGAVVGLQPFGGQGLSGTGPKAGGPHYLLRLCHEKTYTVDTTAAGGNATLMSLPEGGI